MPKFNLYSAWMDPMFYLWGAAFAAALLALVYSIRRSLELKNKDVFEEEEQPEAAAENPFTSAEPAEQPELPEAAPEPVRNEPAQAQHKSAAADSASSSSNRAETFVRGIYEGISGLDARLKGIESHLAKSRGGNEFTVKFLEDILQDIETLDKAKIRARIEYLVSDLKK